MVSIATQIIRQVVQYIYAYDKCYYFTVSFPVATKPKNGIRSVHVTNTMIAHRASGI